MQWEHNAAVFKALSDVTRLKIVEMLSCGEMCACEILESFHITQPTLSYHMKILSECGLVYGRKDGSWMRYRLSEDTVSAITQFWSRIISPDNETCICNKNKEECTCVSSSSAR